MAMCLWSVARERPAKKKKRFNTIADQMGRGQGMRFTSEDPQLADKWGKHSIPVEGRQIEEREIKTTVLCLLKQQRKQWQCPMFHSTQWCCEARTQMDPGECIIWKTYLKPLVKSHANVYTLCLKEKRLKERNYL